MNKLNAVDSAQANPNLDQLHEYFHRALDHFFNADGSMKREYFEDISCYHCGSSEIVSEFTADRFRHVRCAKCNMVYVSPRLKAQTVHDSYNEEHYNHFYKIKLIPSIDYRRNVIAKNKYEQIMKYVKGPGSILDIGCGLGEFLSVFSEKGWECLGVEFNEFAANYAKENFRVKVIPKSIFDFTAASGQYDCITLWGVLEHFTKPQDVLAKAYEILKPGGVLVLEVPSGDSVLVRYIEAFGGPVNRIIEGDRHNMLFSFQAFCGMVEEKGFIREHVQSNGLDLTTLTSLHNQSMDKDFMNKVQDAIDRALAGDLLRGFWRKPLS
jgi:2-polyprenyl-3-methyl-5-hydroxy-6-metoxy-1,4-benzoquinol methylase